MFSNCMSVLSQDRAGWIDAGAANLIVQGFLSKAPAQEHLLIKAPYLTVRGLRLDSPGFGGASGAVPGIVLDSSAGALTGLSLDGVAFTSRNGTQASVGFHATGANTITGSASVIDASGCVAVSDAPATFGVVWAPALGGQWTSYTPTVTSENNSFAAGSVTATGKVRALGKTIEWQANVMLPNPLPTSNPPSGSVKVSLPFPVAYRAPLSGEETALAAFMLTSNFQEGTSTALVKKYDGSSAIGAGYTLTVGGTYQTS